MKLRFFGMAAALAGVSLGLASCPAPGAARPSTTTLPALYAVYQTPTGGFLAAYTIASDGTPMPAGGPVGAGNGTIVATIPAGRFVYVSDQTAGNEGIWVYHANARTGAPSPVSEFPLFTPGTPSLMAADPGGRYLYVLNSIGATELDANAIDQTTGSLADFYTTGLTGPEALAVHPSGSFVYVTDSVSGVVCVPVDAATGSFGPASSFPTGTLPVGVAITPDGKHLYVADQSGQSIYGYSIDTATGDLSLLPTTPLGTGGASTWLVIDPKGRFLYSAENGGPATIHGYRIDPTTGALSAIPGTPLSFPGADATAPAIDPSGQFLYGGDSFSSGSQFHAYRIDQTSGGLSELSGSPYTISGAISITTLAAAAVTAPSR